jgi:hypothetical protein
MILTPKILLVDDDVTGRRRLAGALREKFPDAIVNECEGYDVPVPPTDEFNVVITHQANDRALRLVWQFRDTNSHTPLILVSDVHRRETAKAAGANELLHCNEWQRIGAVVEDVLATKTNHPMYRQYA